MNTAIRAAGTTLAGLVAIAWAGAALAQDAPAGDPKRGGEVFKAQCAVCHTAEKGKASPIGPSLYGIVGRPAGSLEGFRYSDAMKKVGVDWTPANLDKYLENPWQIAPGTPMALVVPVVKNRQDVIAYLKSVGPQ